MSSQPNAGHVMPASNMRYALASSMREPVSEWRGFPDADMFVCIENGTNAHGGSERMLIIVHGRIPRVRVGLERLCRATNEKHDASKSRGVDPDWEDNMIMTTYAAPNIVLRYRLGNGKIACLKFGLQTQMDWSVLVSVLKDLRCPIRNVSSRPTTAGSNVLSSSQIAGLTRQSSDFTSSPLSFADQAPRSSHGRPSSSQLSSYGSEYAHSGSLQGPYHFTSRPESSQHSYTSMFPDLDAAQGLDVGPNSASNMFAETFEVRRGLNFEFQVSQGDVNSRSRTAGDRPSSSVERPPLRQPTYVPPMTASITDGSQSIPVDLSSQTEQSLHVTEPAPKRPKRSSTTAPRTNAASRCSTKTTQRKASAAVTPDQRTPLSSLPLSATNTAPHLSSTRAPTAQTHNEFPPSSDITTTSIHIPLDPAASEMPPLFEQTGGTTSSTTASTSTQTDLTSTDYAHALTLHASVDRTYLKHFAAQPYATRAASIEEAVVACLADNEFVGMVGDVQSVVSGLWGW